MKGNEKPRYLPQVLQAIADLRELGGATPRKIVNVLQSNLKGNKPRNLTVHVRRALEHGVEKGLLRQRQGKYYKIILDPLKGCSACKRKGRRGSKRKKGGRRRRRHHAIAPDLDMSEDDSIATDSATDSEWERSRSRTPEPSDRSKRRKKGKKRRGRRHSEISNPDGKGGEQNKPKDYSEEFRQRSDLENRPECLNPDCLCNLKPENLKQEPVDDKKNFRTDYIN